MSKKNDLDQYYTNPVYAEHCSKVATPWFTDFFVEPCAGTGSFFNLMPIGRRLGMDLDPKVSGDGMKPEPQDFLKYRGYHKDCTVLSNPPFGFSCSLAIPFFNQCADMGASVIAFVIPRTFRKAHVINKLDPWFHLEHDETSPDDAFILNGEPYHVPCCFQIWVRKDFKRKPIDTDADCPYITFVEKHEDPDFAFRRVGGRAGKLLDGLDYNGVSTYFIKATIEKDVVENALKSIDLSEEACNTVGVRSVAKYEIVNKLNEYFSEYKKTNTINEPEKTGLSFLLNI